MSPGEVEEKEMEEEVEEEVAPTQTAQQQMTWGQFSCETRSQSAKSCRTGERQPARWSGLTDEEPVNKHTNGTEEPPQLRVAVPGQPRDQESRTPTLLRTLAC